MPLAVLLMLPLGCGGPDALEPQSAPEPAGLPAAETARPPAAEPVRESLVHVDIPAKVAEGQGDFKADWSFDLVANERWSAHVHVIPQHQLVPAHQHPDNDELVFVAAGRGEWSSWTWDPATLRVHPRDVGAAQERHGSVRNAAWELATGSVTLSPKGSVHGVRNRQPEPLTTVVLHRPEFGQNWYVVPAEVRSETASGEFDPAQPGGAFEGWTIRWLQGDALSGLQPASPSDQLYFVAAGQGALYFEEHRLPLRPGVFVKVPPALDHELRAEGSLRVLQVRIPRSG